jgi:hypothetical protein
MGVISYVAMGVIEVGTRYEEATLKTSRLRVRGLGVVLISRFVQLRTNLSF